MGYSFWMSFIHAESKAEAFLKANEFMSAVMTRSSVNELLRENLILFRRSASQKVDFENNVQLSDLLSNWLYRLFSIRCTYWPQHNLLGIAGARWPECCTKLTAGMVLFQNGTDQNYECDLWPNTIPFFQKRIEVICAMSDEEIVQENNLIDESDYNDERIAYARRSLLYRRIFDDLDLNSWLYEKSGQFERFAMSGITRFDDEMNLYTRAKAMLLRGV